MHNILGSNKFKYFNFCNSEFISSCQIIHCVFRFVSESVWCLIAMSEVAETDRIDVALIGDI